MKKIVWLFLLIMLSSVVFANGQEICDYLIEEKGINIGTTLPKAMPYKNDIFNVYTIDGDIIGHIKLENRIVKSIDCNLIENPDFIVKVKDLEVVKSITSADTLNQALKANEITIEGQSITKKIKNTFTKLGIKIVSLFS
jgi:hypothetical protein